jgi:filamentous hemagglutinin family protein
MLKALFAWLGLSLCTLSYLGSTNNPVLAQVTSDGTVNTEVNTDGNTAEITGGETREGNLFHSFEDFSVETGNEAFFNNADSISNIFSRVTGGNVSDIDGAIRANGSANLFLINPAGIIFGENASLNIGGSFYGSSASSILFEDGEFSATDLDNPPLLTVNAPIGLGFRDQPGDIVNRASTGDGLEVTEGKTISLIGGNVTIENSGFIFAPGGIIELGGLIETGTISFNDDSSFSFPENIARGNVSLTDSSIVSTVNSSGNAGNINLTTGSLSLNNGASLFAFGNNQSSAGNITIRANDTVSLANQSNINVATSGDRGFLNIDAKSLEITSQSSLIAGILPNSGSAETQAGDIVINVAENVLIDSLDERAETQTNIANSNFGTGNAGNIIINAKNIDFKNGGSISNNNKGEGNIGSINLNATEEITFDGTQSSSQSGVLNFVSENGTGDIGSINITAQNLTLTNGAAIDSAVAGVANSGDINIEVSDTIRIDGISSNLVSEDGTLATLNSQISSRAAIDSNGNSGDIDIKTGALFISNGGAISSDLFGQGNGGNIKIDATNTVSIEDSVEGVLPAVGTIEFPSNISARVASDAVGNGGNIEINTENFSFTNLAQLTTSNFGQGDAGNIEINTENFSITNLAQLTTTSSGQGDAGNISVNTENFIADSSFITSNIGSSTEVPAVGKVGNIFITGRDIALTGTAQIQAGAFSGARVEATGTVSLTASESISLTGTRTGIFSDSDPGSFGNASNIQLFAPTITLNDGVIIEASNAANGQGGNVTVESEQLILNGSSISADAEGEEGKGANITLNVAEDISLQNNSFISARALNNADGGNLNIDTNFIVAFPSNGNGNDIIASAEQGQGGNININADSLLGIEERSLNDSTNDINASSNFDLDGTININTSKIDPLQGATELPSNVVEVKQTADQTCSANRQGEANNGLAIAGRGGVSPAPDAPLNSESISNQNPAQASIPQPLETSQGKIQPARGIEVTESGKIVLTAYRTNNAGERISEGKINCGQI